MSQSNIFSCKSATVHTPISVSEFVCGHNSVSTGARKLKYGMKDACSRIGTFSHFLKIPLFYPEIGKIKRALFPIGHPSTKMQGVPWHPSFQRPCIKWLVYPRIEVVFCVDKEVWDGRRWTCRRGFTYSYTVVCSLRSWEKLTLPLTSVITTICVYYNDTTLFFRSLVMSY